MHHHMCFYLLFKLNIDKLIPRKLEDLFFMIFWYLISDLTRLIISITSLSSSVTTIQRWNICSDKWILNTLDFAHNIGIIIQTKSTKLYIDISWISVSFKLSDHICTTGTESCLKISLIKKKFKIRNSISIR